MELIKPIYEGATEKATKWPLRSIFNEVAYIKRSTQVLNKRWRTPKCSPRMLNYSWRPSKRMWRQVNDGWRHACDYVAFIELLTAGVELLVASA
jgi:hypothetical protein